MTTLPIAMQALWPQRSIPARCLVDPVAFTAALVLSPLTVALLGFWLLLIPVVAVPLGLPTYLLFGAPILAATVTRPEVSKRTIAKSGFVAHLVSLPFVALAMGLAGGSIEDVLPWFAVLGGIFAPLWAWVFALYYRRFARTFYSTPR